MSSRLTFHSLPVWSLTRSTSRLKWSITVRALSNKPSDGSIACNALNGWRYHVPCWWTSILGILSQKKALLQAMVWSLDLRPSEQQMCIPPMSMHQQHVTCQQFLIIRQHIWVVGIVPLQNLGDATFEQKIRKKWNFDCLDFQQSLKPQICYSTLEIMNWLNNRAHHLKKLPVWGFKGWLCKIAWITCWFGKSSVQSEFKSPSFFWCSSFIVSRAAKSKKSGICNRIKACYAQFKRQFQAEKKAYD